MKQIKVKNLDTGQEMDLVEAEDQLPASVNPLSLHIMRLTNEYVSGDRSQVKSMSMSAADSDTESLMSSVSSYTLGGKKKKNSVKKFFGSMAKKTSDAAKSLTIGDASISQKISYYNVASQLRMLFTKYVDHFLFLQSYYVVQLI